MNGTGVRCLWTSYDLALSSSLICRQAPCLPDNSTLSAPARAPPLQSCMRGLGVELAPSCVSYSPLRIKCPPGYAGTVPNCTALCGLNCMGRGECLSDGVTMPSCRCNEGFSGPLCELLDCPGTPPCGGAAQGNCRLSKSGLPMCECGGSWTGPNCTDRMLLLLSGFSLTSFAAVCVPSCREGEYCEAVGGPTCQPLVPPPEEKKRQAPAPTVALIRNCSLDWAGPTCSLGVPL